jgi:UDP-4-amino-4,6-dideoxy-N-acetyl-beta-L-altrosamine N-acetyltransferase
MRAGDLGRVLAWRNHPNVKRHMLTQHEITLGEHLSWFERASNDATKRLLIVEEGELSLGFVSFSGVAPGGVSDWGFYATPDAPRGSGRKLGFSALDYAFETLELHKICGQALGQNEASCRFHWMLGFQQEGVLRDQQLIGGSYHDLICFGLLRGEWTANKSGRIESHK